jgi:hypothetical protein
VPAATYSSYCAEMTFRHSSPSGPLIASLYNRFLALVTAAASRTAFTVAFLMTFVVGRRCRFPRRGSGSGIYGTTKTIVLFSRVSSLSNDEYSTREASKISLSSSNSSSMSTGSAYPVVFLKLPFGSSITTSLILTT